MHEITPKLSKITMKVMYELLEIAPALSLEEAAEYTGTALKELNEDDKLLFKKYYTRGKYELRVKAVTAIKDEMKAGKDKLKPALSVLLRFSNQWEQLNDSEAAGGGLVANINLTGLKT